MFHDVAKLVDKVREHYLRQFIAFVEIQDRAWVGGGSVEMKFSVTEPTDLFRGIYAADFAINCNNKLHVREFIPGNVLAFDPLIFEVLGATVRFERLEWNDVVILYEGPELDPSTLDCWFEYWFDPADLRSAPGIELGGIIHALFARPGYLCVDFGTAAAEALWDLLDLVASIGPSAIRLTCQEGE